MTFHTFELFLPNKERKKRINLIVDWPLLKVQCVGEGWEMQQKPGFSTLVKLPRAIHQNFPRESSTTFEAFFPLRLPHKNLPQECKNFLRPRQHLHIYSFANQPSLHRCQILYLHNFQEINSNGKLCQILGNHWNMTTGGLCKFGQYWQICSIDPSSCWPVQKDKWYCVTLI